MYQSKAPLSGSSPDKWKYDSTTEASVLGSQFAHAVIMVANGNADDVIRKKKNHSPCRKIFWEETRFNPALENTNNNYAYDAHAIEEVKHWKKGGKKFVGGSRFAPPRNHNGPLIPGEIEHTFEKPIPMFERSVTPHPFERARKYNKPHSRSVQNPEKAYLEMRTSLIGPSTYTLPDLWEKSKSEGLEVNGAKQSVFKSGTPRFKSRKSHKEDFPVEKEGTTIPHSRGRSRGGGFKEIPRPVSEGEIAAKLLASSISTWESFQDAPSDQEIIPPSTHDLQETTEAVLLNSSMSPSNFYQATRQQPGLSARKRAQTTANDSYFSANYPIRQMSLHSGVLGPNAELPNNLHANTSGRRGVSSTCINTSKSMSALPRTPSGYESPSTSLTPGKKGLKSRQPGFSFLSKNIQPIFSVPDYNKSYKRVVLADGTAAIVPVTTTAGAAAKSSPTRPTEVLSLSNRDSHSSAAVQYDGSQQAMLQLIGNSGPQVRSLTPPCPVPLSLTKGNLYSNLRNETAPQQSVFTRDGDLLDDESTSQSLAATKGSVSNSSYSKVMIQKWVPPVYYSNKHKSAVPEAGDVPYKFKRGGTSPMAGRPPRMSDDMMPSQRASPHSRLYATTHSTATASASVAELYPLNASTSSAEGYEEGNREVVRRRTFMGGVNAGERPRSRQDSIGAIQLPVGEYTQRALASRESQQILLSAVQET